MASHRNLSRIPAIDADDRNRSEISAALDRLSKNVRPVRSHEGRDLDPVDTESKLAVVSGSVPTASMQASAPRPAVNSWMRS